MNANDVLREIYYDPKHPASYGSVSSLYKAAKLIIPSLTYKIVNTWLLKQDVYSLHGRLRRQFKRRKTIAKGLNYQMQMDLIDLNNIKGYNNNSRYLLTAIDVFSRKAFAIPVRTKQPKSILSALHLLFEHHPYPRYVQFDQGLEFFNAPVKSFLKNHNVKQFFTSSDMKCSIVERFNRTLKSRMFKYFTANNTLRYIDVLHHFVNAYNDRRHRSIGIAPNRVTSQNEKSVWDYQYKSYFKKYKSAKYKFEIGDTVRIAKLKKQFRKGYLPTFQDEYFRIHSRLATVPPTYKLVDRSGEVLVGAFYRDELHLVLPVSGQHNVLKRRKRKGIRESLIHYVGQPAGQQTWVPDKTLHKQ